MSNILKKIFHKIKSFFIEKDKSYLSFSMKGRKQFQEDAYYQSPKNQNGRIVIVADGVGGHGHGDFASNLCVNYFKNAFENEKIKDPIFFLRTKAMDVATLVLEKGQENKDFKNAGTTLSGFLLQENFFYTVNIGDSRVYKLDKKDNFSRLTKDHSFVQNLIDKGEITEKEAFSHNKRNMLTSAIGQSLEMIKIDISDVQRIEKGDFLFVFSDGVHDALTDEEIKNILIVKKENENIAEIIAEASFDNGGKDNITVCIYKH